MTILQYTIIYYTLAKIECLVDVLYGDLKCMKFAEIKQNIKHQICGAGNCGAQLPANEQRRV